MVCRLKLYKKKNSVLCSFTLTRPYILKPRYILKCIKTHLTCFFVVVVKLTDLKSGLKTESHMHRLFTLCKMYQLSAFIDCMQNLDVLTSVSNPDD